MSSENLAIVVLAAGQGKRMMSDLPKVLHPVLGEPMIGHVLRQCEALKPARVVVVTGHGRDQAEAWIETRTWSCPVQFVEQVAPRGTGHAMQCAMELLDGCDEVLVLYGDVPLLRPSTLASLLDARASSPVSVLIATVPDTARYGRVVVDQNGRIERIVEHADATEEQRQIRQINAGMMAIDIDFARRALTQLEGNNAQGELYLTDLLAIARDEGSGGVPLEVQDWTEIQGINTRAECAAATDTLRRRVNDEHMSVGVTLLAPDRTWIEASVSIQRDATIAADVELRGATQVAANAYIDRGCVLRDVEVGASALVKPYTVATESKVGEHCQVGPFAHLRPGTVLEAKVKVGNFVETKKAVLHEGAKASHLSYIGDADIGAGSNIGAGTITCNYDGTNKYRTVLGEGVFIGSDTQLVAPVTLGEGAYVGAGSTITGDVPAGALALSRTEQRNIEGWVARKQAKKDSNK